MSDAELRAAAAEIFAEGGEILPRHSRDIVRGWLSCGQDRRRQAPDLDQLLSEKARKQRASSLAAAAGAYVSAVSGDLPTVELAQAARNLQSDISEQNLERMRADRQKAIQEAERDCRNDADRRAR